ncbi:MAG: hypothetical protein H6842_15305 [Rhodospirillaceae bacterium]|nr:hypothetical protein [Rhodospirillaceae bacterium]
MTPWIRPLDFEALTQVALNMRAIDAQEIFACRRDRDATALALELMAAVRLSGCAWCAGRDRPVAVFGAVELWPGRWSALMFATEEWPGVALAVTRFVRNDVMPMLLGLGARRCEVRSMATHHDAHRWLEHLGARAEGVHPDEGCGAEPFITYAWTRSHVHLQRTETAAPAGTAAAADP